MKKTVSCGIIMVLLITLVFSWIQISAAEIIDGDTKLILHGSAGTEVSDENTYGSGEWIVSGLMGYDGVTPTIYNYDGEYKWFTTLENGTYEVFIFVICHNNNTVPGINIEVGQGDTVLSSTIINYVDGVNGESGWVSLGVFPFDSTSEVFVKNSIPEEHSDTTNRADAVKFVKVAGNEPIETVETIEAPVPDEPQETAAITPAEPVTAPAPATTVTAAQTNDGFVVFTAITVMAMAAFMVIRRVKS